MFNQAGDWIDTVLAFDTKAQRTHAKLVLREAGRRMCDNDVEDVRVIDSIDDLRDAFDRNGGEDVTDVIATLTTSDDEEDPAAATAADFAAAISTFLPAVLVAAEFEQWFRRISELARG